MRPHILGIDDGPFRKSRDLDAPIVGVVTEGATLVEAIAVTRFPVDGDGATEFLAEWIAGLRFRPALQGVVLGGITIAGLGIVDIRSLARTLDLPVLSATRRDTAASEIRRALHAAGLENRLAIVERTPAARRVRTGLWIAAGGADEETAERLVRATLQKSRLPEPLRIAHLVGAALAKGESRGRV
jgi:endonuclease V-like protein UPF0215 family